MSEVRFQIELTSDEIRQLAESTEFHFKNWPGYPAAEKEEQERLWHNRRLLRALLMEVAYHRDT